MDLEHSLDLEQIWFYIMDLPGFSALPGFKAPFYGDGQSALNPGTTVLVSCTLHLHVLTHVTLDSLR